MNQILTVTNEGAVRFMTYKETMSGVPFVVFLGQRARSTSKETSLMTGRLKAHDDDTVHDWVEAHSGSHRTLLSAGYCPGMNPVEYLNSNMKATVNAAGLPDHADTLRSRIQQSMRRLPYGPGMSSVT